MKTIWQISVPGKRPRHGDGMSCPGVDHAGAARDHRVLVGERVLLQPVVDEAGDVGADQVALQRLVAGDEVGGAGVDAQPGQVLLEQKKIINN